MTARLGRMLAVPIGMMGSEEIRMRKVELTVESQIDGSKYGFGNSEPVRLWGETRTHFLVPRKYGLSKLGGLGSVIDDRSEGQAINLSFKKPLRPQQEDPVQRFLQTIRTTPWNGGILDSPCGSGKTIMLLKLIVELGRTALVVVHTEFLMDQWKDRIQEFIGLPLNKIGRVQGSLCGFKDRPITIGMVQSLAEKNYPSELYDHFGTVVFDEVHRMGAPHFSLAVPRFSAKYRMGASATPTRKDGLEQVFLTHIGDVVGGIANWEVKPKVYQTFIPPMLLQSMYQSGRKVALARLVTDLTELPKRNLFIANEVVKAVRKDRKVLVLSDRLDHLDVLKRMITNLEPKARVGKVIGGIDEQTRIKNSAGDVILATTQYVKEGFDCPELDTLYLTCPHTDVEQQVGRILRSSPGKKTPLVIDLVDSMPVMMAFARKRALFYASKEFEVAQIRVTA